MKSLISCKRSARGVYVVGVFDGRRTNAFTASSVVPVSFKPVMVAVAVGNEHASRPILHGGMGLHHQCAVIDGGVLAQGEPLLYRDTHNLDGARELYPPQMADAGRARPFTVRC